MTDEGLFSFGFPHLLRRHYDMFHDGSGITDEVIRERGAESVLGRKRLADLGFSKAQQRTPGVLLPVHAPDGTNALCVYRPDDPRLNDRGRPRKYELPVGAAVRLDVPPRCRPQLGDPKVPLALTEGQRKADAAASAGLCCVDLLGVWNFRGKNAKGGVVLLADLDSIALNGRRVLIAFDSDVTAKPQVAQALDRLTEHVQRRGADVHRILLPSPDGAKVGLDDYLLDHSVEDFLALAEQPGPPPAAAVRPKSQAAKLIELAESAELFHDENGTSYATFNVGGHVETWPLRSAGFKSALARALWTQDETAASSQALQDALNVLTGRALFDGPELAVRVRVAHHDGRVYVDLADRDWRVVEIDTVGWRVLDRAPAAVRFRRPRGALALPEPMRGGNADELRPFLNLADDDGWRLFAGFLVAALSPGPYLQLHMRAAQDSGKTTAAKLLRSLLDPSEADVRAEPREPRDLAIMAGNCWLVSLDNLSGVRGWLSDALCRLSTGAAFSTRELYSDDEERIFRAKRPVVLNGIAELATKADLLDRALLLELAAIPDSKRRDETEFWQAWEQARPLVLGALYDAVSAALRNLPTVRLTSMPRMADASRWVTASEPSLGWPSGAFVAAYSDNRDVAAGTALDASTIGTHLLTLLDTNGGSWEGTASDLLADLDGLAPEAERRGRLWPKNGRAASTELWRLQATLAAHGIAIDSDRVGKKRVRTLHLQKVADFASAPSAPSAVADFRHETAPETADAKPPEADAKPPEADAKTARRTQIRHADEADAKIPTQSMAPEREGHETEPAPALDLEALRLWPGAGILREGQWTAS